MHDDPYAHRRFRRIETRAVLPDGRVRTSSYSYPLGVGKDVYDAIDRALVRAYGNDSCRTTGTFFEDTGTVLKSDRTRRDGLMPVPCIACGKEMDSAANDPHFDHVPGDGVIFHSGGNYGSTVFDSFDGFQLQVVVCDACLKTYAEARVRLVDPKGGMTPWDGETSDYELGTPEYEERQASFEEAQQRLLAEHGGKLTLLGEPGF
jgi:hypothetical protein